MAEYRTPFETDHDPADLHEWRRLTSLLLRQRIARSRLVNEVLSLTVLPLFGPTPPKEREDTATTLSRVFASASAALLRAGVPESHLTALMTQASAMAAMAPTRRAS